MKLHVKVSEHKYIQVEGHELHNSFSFLAVWDIIRTDLKNHTNRYLQYCAEMEKRAQDAVDRKRCAADNAASNEEAILHGDIRILLEGLQNGRADCKRSPFIGRDDEKVQMERLIQNLSYKLLIRSPEFIANNRTMIEKIIHDRGDTFKTDMEYTLFRLFILLHAQANCNIMAAKLDKGGLPWFHGGKTSVQVLHTLLDEARYTLGHDTIRSARVLEIAPERKVDVALPPYGKHPMPEDPIRLVRIEKKKNGNLENGGEPTEVKLGDDVRTLYPGDMLFALRAGGEYIRLLPNVHRAGGYTLMRKKDDPHTLTLQLPNGRTVDTSYEEMPANWAYSSVNDSIVCIDETGRIHSDMEISEGVLISIYGSYFYVLRQDGTVWSNAKGADALKNIVYLSAELNSARLWDTEGQMWRLRNGTIKPAEPEEGSPATV